MIYGMLFLSNRDIHFINLLLIFNRFGSFIDLFKKKRFVLISDWRFFHFDFIISLTILANIVRSSVFIMILCVCNRLDFFYVIFIYWLMSLLILLSIVYSHTVFNKIIPFLKSIMLRFYLVYIWKGYLAVW